MRGKSHICLGNYLLQHYLPELSQMRARAFLLGCISPDRNPSTYLKGSLRHQWLRGHNYRNARRYMRKIALRLERKTHFSLLDYYTLGKLIHYTADAFTYAHNAGFSGGLADHREYEILLQNYFLQYILHAPTVEIPNAGSIMEAIGSCHRTYLQKETGIVRDSRCALQACCCILSLLTAPQTYHPEDSLCPS